MPKTPTDIRSLARAHTNSALRTLKGIMEQGDAPPAARVSAAQALLDRGWGKAMQVSEVTLKRVAASQIGDDELANIALGSSEGTAEEADDPPVSH